MDKGSGEVVSKDRKGFIVYGDIKEVLKELTDDQVAQLFRGMVNYFVDGKAPKFTGVLKFVWIPIKQHMDRDAEKYDAKCKKMRENANKRWNNANAYNGIQLDANDANKDKEKDKDKIIGIDKDIKSAETDNSTDNLVFFKGFK